MYSGAKFLCQFFCMWLSYFLSFDTKFQYKFFYVHGYSKILLVDTSYNLHCWVSYLQRTILDEDFAAYLVFWSGMGKSMCSYKKLCVQLNFWVVYYMNNWP